MVNLKRSYTDFSRDGKVRAPRWCLEECLNAFGQTFQQYNWLVKKYPGAPEPVLSRNRPGGNGQQNLYDKQQMFRYIKHCLDKEKEFDINKVLQPYFDNGWTQSAIAESAGIHRSGLNRYLSGKMGMTAETKEALLLFIEKNPINQKIKHD